MLLGSLPEQNSVKFGNLFLKPGNVSEVASESCRLVLMEADDPTFPMGFAGSSTLIRFRDRKYIALTRHQLSIPPGEEPNPDTLDALRIVTADETVSNIPVQKCRFETSNSDEEFHDLLFFEVADGWDRHNFEAPFFVPVRDFGTAEREISYVFGHPSDQGIMSDYIESHLRGRVGSINIKILVADCRLDTEFRSRLQHYRRYTGGPKNYNYDGLSGGPVFSLVKSVDGYEFVFDGITVRGGNGSIYTVDSTYIANALST